jgi:hypothetical protein
MALLFSTRHGSALPAVLACGRPGRQTSKMRQTTFFAAGFAANNKIQPELSNLPGISSKIHIIKI